MTRRSTVGAKPTARPIAMVAPVPSRPARNAPLMQLEDILKLLGNDRAYTVLASHGHIWKVHFEGDVKPSLVAMEKGKPIIALILDD